MEALLTANVSEAERALTEKPLLATMMSLSVALVFPITMLGALWPLGLDGIWLNFVGVNALAAILGLVLRSVVNREIKKKEAAQKLALAE